MAFCNSCGERLESGARFCAKCGAAQPGGAATPVATPAAPSPAPAGQPQSSSALKVILIIVAVFVGLGVLGVGTAAFIGWRIAHHTRITDKDGNVRVESPFGTIESSNNADETARNLGVDIYPGAKMRKGNSANISIAGMHTVSAEYETDDAADKVADFYRAKFPNANVTATDQGRTTIVSTDQKNLITVNIEPTDGKTVIHIANVSGKRMGGGSN
jgi:hypothetical protein